MSGFARPRSLSSLHSRLREGRQRQEQPTGRQVRSFQSTQVRCTLRAHLDPGVSVMCVSGQCVPCVCVCVCVHIHRQSLAQELCLHFASVNKVPEHIQASPQGVAMWAKEIMCRVYALQVLARCACEHGVMHGGLFFVCTCMEPRLQSPCQRMPGGAPACTSDIAQTSLHTIMRRYIQPPPHA